MENQNNKINPNKNPFLIIAIIVGIVAIGVVGFLNWRCSEEISELENEKFQQVDFSTKEKTETINDISNWKTYRNEEYGFEFRYPLTYFLKDQLTGEEKAVLLGDKEFQKPDIAPWYHSPISIGPTNFVKNTEIINSLTNKITNTIEIDGVKAEIVEGKYASYPVNISNIYRMKIIIISKKDLIVKVQELYGGEISDWDEILETTTKMLSTFKFIEKEKIADFSDETLLIEDWETYKNDEYGFEVKFPEEWQIIGDENDVSFLSKTEGMNAFVITALATPNKSFENAEQIKINDINFYKFPHQFGGDSWMIVLYTVKNNLVYRIMFDEENPNDENFKEHYKIFNQILSTFKFTE